MANDPPTTLPLQGLRVLDFTQNLPGPYASFLLASSGADVVKIEPPRGDPGRSMEPFFSMVNRGKRSVVLDLRDPASKPALQALVEWADVLLEGFRPGVMGRLGCDWHTAKAWNPSLIYCSISAYGQTGPRAGQPAHDLNLQALSGACHLQRDAQGHPQGSALPTADLSTSLVAVSSICMALQARHRDGQGRYLDVAMSDAVLSWTQLWGEGVDLTAPARRQLGAGAAFARPFLEAMDRRKLFVMSHYGLFPARDGKWMAVGIVDEKHFWKGLCEVIGHPRLARLPLAVRTMTGPLLRRLIARRLRRRPRADWLSRFEQAGVPVSPVHALDDLAAEPQFRARDLIDGHGRVRAPLPMAVHLDPQVPGLGEHTAAVLAELGVASG